MSEHTEGPWHVEECRDGWEVCNTVDGESGHVALFPPATGEADARLCASAPDLLAACKALVADLAEPTIWPGADARTESWRAVLAAIAKAEGR